MKKILLFLIFIALENTTRGQDIPRFQSGYAKEVGDIMFDPKFDDPAFNFPDTTIIFSKPRIDREKPAIVNYFKDKYSNKGFENINGYITIHFLVNSDGKAGRFRIQTMNFEHQPSEFDSRALTQFLTLMKALNGWQPISYEGRHYGYYSYLNFKMVDGDIKEITP